MPLQPGTDYKLSAWVRTRGVSGALGALLNVHGTRFQTTAVSGDAGWRLVETTSNSGKLTTASVNLLFGGYGQSKGEAWFDDVKLCVASVPGGAPPALAGDIKRGELIFFKHAAVSCVLCHSLNGQGSTVGPALDGIASRKDAKYIEESLLDPNKALAEGFVHLGASPMPPLGVILKPQEIKDIEAFLQTLK